MSESTSYSSPNLLFTFIIFIGLAMLITTIILIVKKVKQK